MLHRLASIVLAAATIAVAGCAGRDFVRPDSSELRMNQSTYSQVVAKLGEPRNTGEVLKNGEKIKTITYAYASAGGEPLQSSVIPARAMAYFFHQDRLVGQQFVSSFKVDNSNFDDTKVSTIEKGKTTRAEVIQLLGKPTATFVKPMVKDTSGEAIGYAYQTASRGASSGLAFFSKILRIAFDSSDRVLEVDYSSTGSK